MHGKEILKCLYQDGWELLRVKGSHYTLRHDEKGRVTVPVHGKKDIPVGTVKSIEKSTGVKLLK